jgi:DNA-binding CsgD family transcriptional regulator
MSTSETALLELTEAAASAGPLPQRAEALLGALRRVVPYDGAWLALAEPHRHGYVTAGSVDLSVATVAHLSGPAHVRDIEAAGTRRPVPPISLSDLPYAAAELRTWADCLIPAGLHEALVVSLFVPRKRHVGYLALIAGGGEPPSRRVRTMLRRVAPLVAHGIDPMRSLLSAARLVQGATAGVVLRRDGGTHPLPGLDDHPLLSVDSPALRAAHAAIADGRVYTSFLWPQGGRHAPRGHARITALGSTDDVPAILTGMVLVSPPGQLHGLTTRELEVLGLVIDGRSNGQIARALVVAQRTVAAHLEHILAKLSAPTRTLAAVRAEREGLYVPALPAPASAT